MHIAKPYGLALRKDLILLGEVNLRLAVAVCFKLVQHIVKFDENWARSILELIIQINGGSNSLLSTNVASQNLKRLDRFLVFSDHLRYELRYSMLRVNEEPYLAMVRKIDFDSGVMQHVL